MGSKTFEISYNLSQLPTSDKLHIILTRNVTKYSQYQKNGHFEFTDQTPQDIVSGLKKRGYKTGLLLGGSEIYTLFLSNNLVDKLYITLEPRIFGSGKEIIGEISKGIDLIFEEMQQINTQGTILLKYKVNKNFILQKQEIPLG